MEETAAVCSRCGNYMTGKIYDPYICADCKIDELNNELAVCKREREYIEQKYRTTEDESQALRKYKWAFETLVAELSKK
ncbi:hypothetical protein MH050_19235 [Bacillus licheniformis]|uniref:hypothetical protein n=1 Tax=Bacillus licheniformis TaxID=1402 RepID=UPI001CD7C3C5|nr:hypothetical protein [Bacillus licheniformis]MCA1184552.1 hypothetical protein [Bacillus licheniformis]MCY7742946.1 hypothetical protein [Bacillus licheniformis]